MRNTARLPYEVGILARGILADLVAYGRSLGLDVQVHRGGGMLVQRGYLVASGDPGALFRFVEHFRKVAQAS